MSTNTTFDDSLKRDENKSFKNTNAKRVPHEELDFRIYKANSVTFSTTEIRLPLWIKALYNRYCKNAYNDMNKEPETILNTKWLEQDNATNSARCDKISLDILLNENENILTITIYVNTGRIQAQGRLLQEWDASEFNNLIAMVNSPDTSWNNENIKPFLQTISKPKNDKTQINSQSTNTADQTTDNTSVPTSPREKSFTT